MGCNTSKLDDEEAVQICKDRKKFIKQALEHRTKFASGHIAYVQSLKRVSAALREYIEGDEPREFSLDSFITPPYTPVKKVTPKFITISPKCFSAPAIQSQSQEHSSVKINHNYYRPSGSASVSVEERPQSPDTYRIHSYSPVHQYGFDGFFSMQSPQTNAPYYSTSPYNRPSITPASPQNSSQWDFFWNPFSSLDYYGYPTRDSLEQSGIDDDPAGLRQVREAEGIPDLEEETEHEDLDVGNHRREQEARTSMHHRREQEARTSLHHRREEPAKTNVHHDRREETPKEEVTVEDADEDEDDEEDDDEEETDCEDQSQHARNDVQAHASNTTEVSQVPKGGQIEINRYETMVTEREKREHEAPGFTVYVNKRPTSMDEVIKDLESQFKIICSAANEVSALLEASPALCLTPSSEVAAIKMLNPVALFRSASSRSNSSRFLATSSGSSRVEGYESSSELSDDSSTFPGSHHSTLDRLYAWEKRLYEEVRAGERVRLAYEKKCAQLRNQDVKGDDPSTIEKTRIALRDLYTRIKVSIHSIEAISKRIETLRDQELQSQLLELVQGLAKMWKVMAESHQMQKHTLDEAKLLLAGTPSKLNRSKRYHAAFVSTEPHLLARSAANLEAELRNWKTCFGTWIASQRSYIHALSSWLLRCMRCEPNTTKLPFSPRRSAGVHPIFGICMQWTRLLDAVSEAPVLDGMDFFAAGMGSIYAQQLNEDSRRAQVHGNGSRRFEETTTGMEVAQIGQVEEVMTPEKIAEVAVRVLCAGMSVAMSSLTEFAISSAEGYSELVRQWENAKWPPSSGTEGI